MKLFASLYLDEDVSVLVARLVQARGLDATTTHEQQMLGQPDPLQLAYAVSLERCILTHNRLDYEILHGAYLADGQRHAGIVIAARRSPYEIARRIGILVDNFTADEIAGQLFYI